MSTALSSSPYGASIARSRPRRTYTIIAIAAAVGVQCLFSLISMGVTVFAGGRGGDSFFSMVIFPIIEVVLGVLPLIPAVIALRRGEPRGGAGAALGLAAAGAAYLVLAAIASAIIAGIYAQH